MFRQTAIRSALISSTVLLFFAAVAQGQEKCAGLRGLSQMRLGVALAIPPGGSEPVARSGYIGPSWLTLNSEEILISPNDFDDPRQTVKPDKAIFGAWSVEMGWRKKWVFNPQDSLTVAVTGWFATPEGQTKFENYTLFATVVDGTGRFEGVSGFLTGGGPFMVWFEKPDAPPQARWNVEWNGTLCGVKPKS